MDIKELKDKITKRNLSDSCMVWLLTDLTSDFLARHYIKEIAKSKHLNIKYIGSFKEIASQGFATDDNLYIYKVDKLEDFEPKDNVIILCNKTRYAEAIKIPKLEHWQFIEYIKSKVPGIGKADLEWLITQYETTDSRITTTNYDRLENDLDKIAIFDESVQQQLFNQLYDAGEYNTISNLTIFDLTTAIIKRDTKTALEVLKVFDYIDSKPHVWLLSILLNNFRNILSIQTNSKITAQDLGISDKQFFVIKKHNLGYYDNQQLVKIYKLLTKAEWLYKFGGLSTEQLSDYLVVNILGV